MLTHDQIYERLYPIWQNLPGSNAKVKLGGVLADLEAETLEAEPLAVGMGAEYGHTGVWMVWTGELAQLPWLSDPAVHARPVTLTERKP